MENNDKNVVEASVLIDTVDLIREFAYSMSELPFKATLSHGAYYTVNASSIMGIFSLDVTKPMALRIECDSAASAEHARKVIQPYLAA